MLSWRNNNGKLTLLAMISDLIGKLVALLLLIYCSIVKFLTRKFTGLCELQRICYSTEKGAKRCIQVEQSIANSKSPIIVRIHRKLSELSDQNGTFNCENKYEVTQLVEYVVEVICKAKSINPKHHEDFLDAMRTSLLQIYGYRQLCYDVKSLKNTAYDSNNKFHEQYLYEIWNALNPGDKLDDRISKKWTNIGFQGTNPATDFRSGVGLLGLMNLHYFATKYPRTAQSILLHSNHPKSGYPFAITGINLTHMAYILLNNSQLKTHFFNAFDGTVCLDDFHKFYCYLFVHFDRLWLKEKPRDVMEFSFIKQKFLEQLNDKLTNEHCKLIWEASDSIIGSVLKFDNSIALTHSNRK